MTQELKVNDGAVHAPSEIKRWANKIMEAQGCPATLSQESSGYHLYIPCPECLHTHASEELEDRKYSINLSMIAGQGDDFRDRDTSTFLQDDMDHNQEMAYRRESASSICMRTRSSNEPHRFSLSEIISMGTVSERHPDIHTRAKMINSAGSADREQYWEEDPVTGEKVPPPPGEIVRLTDLPDNHAVVLYLKNRGYDDLEKITKQFRLAFCTKEFPEGVKDIYYRRFPGGWKDTPQHRLIFHSLNTKGSPVTWQARIIEKLSDDQLTKLALHPYRGGGPYNTTNIGKLIQMHQRDLQPNEKIEVSGGPGNYWVHIWSAVATRSNSQGKWIPLAPFDEVNQDGNLKFEPSKYRTAKYSSREMMGIPAALERADSDTDDMRWVVLCEGPLDAARIGPGGIAVLGSSLSPDRSSMVAANFHAVILAFDNDKAGRDAKHKIRRNLERVSGRAAVLQGVTEFPLGEGQDLGDLKQDVCDARLAKLIKKFKRGII